MLRNQLLLTLRTLRKRPAHTAINLVGLGVAFAAALLIGLYAQHELTYDRMHEHAERTYLLYKERVTPAGTQRTEDTWAPLLSALQRDFPAVDGGVRLYEITPWVQQGERRAEEAVTLADASIFDVFSLGLARGDAATALADVGSIVLSQEMAQAYFGDADPLGQTLILDHARPYTVTGVLAPVPSNTTVAPNALIRWESLPEYDGFKDSWGGSFLFTYVLLQEDADPAALEARFPAFIEKTWDAETASRTNFRLEPLTELQQARTGNRRYAYILLGVAALVLLIAGINFTNLATARSLERAKEVGMRKALGAGRRQIARQFLGEAVLLSLLALGFGVLLAEAVLPTFNAAYDLRLTLGADPAVWVGLLAFGLVVGALAGAYPALFMARFRPVRALAGLGGRRSGRRLQQALIATQFTFSIALIACTLVVRDQIAFMQQADLHFDREGLIAIAVDADDFADPEAAQAGLQGFRDALGRDPRVASLTASAHRPGDWAGWFTFARPEGWGDRDPLRLRLAYMDDAYFRTYGIDFVAGRAFSAERATEAEQSVVLNEAAVRDFGWTAEAAVGRTVRRSDTDFRVVGVVEDYHIASLASDIAPVLHFYRPPEHEVHQHLTVRLAGEDVAGVLGMMEQEWQGIDPTRSLPFAFVDDTFAALYETEERLATMAGAFTGLAVLIACLGLFGLAALAAQRRTKEIGVRKVLGASVAGLVLLLSRDFIRLVAIGFVVACPLAAFAARRWLDTFAYRTDLDAVTFFWAGFAALAIALLTVSTQAVRAATADPVDSLRYE